VAALEAAVDFSAMIFIRGARQLVTLRGPALARRGMQLRELGVIPDGALLIDGEEIREVGTTRRIENLAATRSANVIDATGKVILPGFVDSHTRLVLASLPLGPPDEGLLGASAASRPAPYLPSMLRSGSPGALCNRCRGWARWFASHGTTTLEIRSGTLEIRSGFGLDLQSEIVALRAARRLDGDPLEVNCAFLASGPDPYRGPPAAADVGQVIDVLLPIIRRRRLAAVCAVECGPGAFSAEQARQILAAAQALPFSLRVQGDRQTHCGVARLAVEMGALSAEHLQRITDAEIDVLGSAATIATLLPGVVYAEGGDRHAPARRLIDRGAAISLATGFGPASPTLSMPMVLSLACREMKLSAEEAIVAATLNAAAAMGRAERLGSLEPGKQADLAMFDVRDYREIPYYFGFNLCIMTMKKGRVIYRAPGMETLKP
jgi:imidazolonepropionase